MNISPLHIILNSFDALQKKLQQSSTRMRLLERRFFTKLDNKKADSIDSVLTLLKVTHQEIFARIHAMESTKDILHRFGY